METPESRALPPRAAAGARMAPDDKDRAAALDAAVALLGLTVASEWRDVVLAHMKVIGEAARLVEEFPLEDEAESGPVFQP